MKNRWGSYDDYNQESIELDAEEAERDAHDNYLCNKTTCIFCIEERDVEELTNQVDKEFKKGAIKMKVTIRYDYDPKFPDNPFWAISDNGICKNGKTFEEAKQKLINTLRSAKENMPDLVPPIEEVEI